jgi:uncharacterized protein
VIVTRFFGTEASRRRHLTAACLLSIALSSQVLGQSPPTASEVSQYTSLHAAAQRADLVDLKRLLAAGANVNL